MKEEERRIIDSFSNVEIEAMFKACARNAFAGYRDYLMLRLLLDIGVGLSELCNNELGDIDIKDNKIKVFDKAAKDRLVVFSDSTKNVIERWLEYRGKVQGENQACH